MQLSAPQRLLSGQGPRRLRTRSRNAFKPEAVLQVKPGKSREASPLPPQPKVTEDDRRDAPAGRPRYPSVPSRNLALELVRVTEAAALASGRWLGKGDKNPADQAAVDAMRNVLNSIRMDGVVVIGEGEKDQAPMLDCGEHVGDGSDPKVDIAVDPLDGTTLTAQGRNGAIAVIAVAERGALFSPGPVMYMEKIAVGPAVDARRLSLNYTVKQNLQEVARCLAKPISDVTVLMLDRPRHAQLMAECREAGARIRLISDGDVAGAIQTANPGGGVDVMMGIGGTPEGVIAAAALKCMGGELLGRLWPRNEEEREAALAQGYDLKKVLTTHDLVKGEHVFFVATGVSDGDLLKGVRYSSGGASSHSIVMRYESGTVRYIETQHKWKVSGGQEGRDRSGYGGGGQRGVEYASRASVDQADEHWQTFVPDA